VTTELSPEWFEEELKRNLIPQGRLPSGYTPTLDEASLRRLIAPKYTPGLGSRPWPAREEGLKKLAQWLHLEVSNRLDEPNPALVEAALREVAAFASLEPVNLSAPEIRAALACILADAGLPALSRHFERHNQRVNDLTVQALLTAEGLGRERRLSAWLMLLAAANLLEIWPTPPELWAPLEAVRSAAALGGDCSAFRPLAEHLEERLSSGAPLGLMADNHGEAVVDLAFLTWVGRRWRVRTFLFAKACPVETDIDIGGAEALCRRHFPDLVVRIPSGGARTLGNLLPLLGRSHAEALLEVQQGGILLVKGIANLQTVPGVLIDAICLFAAKSAAIAEMFGVPRGSSIGLWLPAGTAANDRAAQFVHTAVVTNPG
jgi:hypothetical protein